MKTQGAARTLDSDKNNWTASQVEWVIDEWLLLEYACCFIPCNPDTLVETVSKSNLDIPPDIIVEVVSPRDVAETVELKVRAYLAAGVRVVWLVYPKAGTVHIRARGVSRVIDGDEVLASEVLPGFGVRVSELLGAR